MSNKIRLIASDLDGTLLLHGAQQCSAEVFPLIEELVKSGVYFVPASGRQYPSLQKLFYPVRDKLTYLCENGSLVMHLDQAIVKREFEDELALELSHAILEQSACEVLISGERTSYVITKNSEYIRHLRDEVGNNVSVVDSPERIEEPIIKVSFFTAAENIKAVEDILAPRFDNRCLRVTSGNEWIDFMPLGTSKGSALRSIGKALGVKPEEMAAFGDNENDRTMLQYVGHPYIMEKCNPTMLDIPAKRCSKVEDTLKIMLEKMI